MSLTGLVLIPPLIGEAVSNNFTGCVGYRFRPARDLVIGGVGRFRGSIFTETLSVRVWSDAGVLLKAAMTSPGSPVDALGYAVGVFSPFTLFGGAFYRIAQTCFVFGDTWVDSFAASAALNPPNTSVSDFDAGVFSAWYGAVDSFPANAAGGPAGYAKCQLYEFVADAVVSRQRLRAGHKVRRAGVRS